MYQESPFINYFENKVVAKDVLDFYWAFVFVFACVVASVTLLVVLLVHKFITKPVGSLKHKIEK